MTRPIEELLQKMGIVPHHTELFAQALTHSSKNGVSNRRFDYERLEFLGDSLIGFVVGSLCYELHPEMNQGELSVLRSQFIRTESEAELAKELGLGDYVMVGPSFTSDPKDSLPLMEDIFESFTGALFLDQGYETAKKFLLGQFYERIKTGKIDWKENPKSQLQELLQADYKEAVTYRLIQEQNTPEGHIFVMGAYFEQSELGRGEGKSKKEAEQNAARDALSKKAFIGLKAS
ncbi:MAG: ribonuclease III [Erysipelotrichaceae bacterium]|nr:ribonuclease III [Erysipelotrichaceae bacterium]